MSSSDSLRSTTPLKAKRSLNLTSDSPISKTPEKRAASRGVVYSVNQVRQAAKTRPKQPAGPVRSARKQILSSPADSPPPKASDDLPDKLPEKYEILCEFFDSLDSAIRLMKMKGSMLTFTNISPKIECLTDRRFSYGHLAQLKHILPEAIEIKRTMVFDERTSCMKPDLHISINVNAIDCGDKSKSGPKNLYLRRLFRARLADFVKGHPDEGDEIPEYELPEPFNRSKQNMRLSATREPISLSCDEPSTDTLTEQQSLTAQGEVIQEETRPNNSNSNSRLAMETIVDANNQQQPVVASHLSRSFQRRFSQRVASKTQVAVQKCTEVSLQSSNTEHPEICTESVAFSNETGCTPAQCPTKALSELATSETSLKTGLPATPVKELNPLKAHDGPPTKAGTIQSTPAKLASTPARLMVVTPTPVPQKRCYMTPEDTSSSTPNKLVKRPRSLIFDTPVKEEKVVDEVHDMAGEAVGNDDALAILPVNLLRSIREKERKAMEERDPAISQAKRRQRMIACLPKLFNLIHYLFQSIKRSVITREELMHKIIAGHCDIVDRGEVEEQLRLLLELAPEWISEKLASAGDLLVCINKVSSPESIRKRLQEAK